MTLKFKLITGETRSSLEKQVNEFLNDSKIERKDIVKIYFSAITYNDVYRGRIIQHNANIVYEVKE
jgi:hypothetical protein